MIDERINEKIDKIAGQYLVHLGAAQPPQPPAIAGGDTLTYIHYASLAIFIFAIYLVFVKKAIIRIYLYIKRQIAFYFSWPHIRRQR